MIVCHTLTLLQQDWVLVQVVGAFKHQTSSLELRYYLLPIFTVQKCCTAYSSTPIFYPFCSQVHGWLYFIILKTPSRNLYYYQIVVWQTCFVLKNYGSIKTISWRNSRWISAKMVLRNRQICLQKLWQRNNRQMLNQECIQHKYIRLTSVCLKILSYMSSLA